MSGTIVERRDHVLMTFFSPRSFIVVDLDHQVLVDERPLLHGPAASATPLPTAADDLLVRRLVLLPRAAFLLPPRRGGMAAARRLALAAAQRVVDRVHRDAAHRRALALPTVAARPCRARSARARRSPRRRPCPCRSPAPSASRPRAAAASRSRPSFAISWTLVPAERAILAPAPGFSSTACTTVPTGMFRSGSALPGRISAPAPDISMSPDPNALRAPGCSASRRRRSAAARSASVRFGSYSMCATLAGHAVLVPAEVDHAGTRRLCRRPGGGW